MEWTSLLRPVIQGLGFITRFLGPHPVVSYELGFTGHSFVLDVRVGNRGYKPYFVSEVWLRKHDSGQSVRIFWDHGQPFQIVENGGQVFTMRLTHEEAEPYANPGAFIEMIDATGRKYRCKLKKKATEFLAKDIDAEMREFEKKLEAVDNSPRQDS